MSEVSYISMANFKDSICSFRDKMGDKRTTPEGRRNMFKQLTINYLNIDPKDPEQGNAADLFEFTAHEYTARMSMMGLRV